MSTNVSLCVCVSPNNALVRGVGAVVVVVGDVAAQVNGAWRAARISAKRASKMRKQAKLAGTYGMPDAEGMCVHPLVLVVCWLVPSRLLW